MTKIWHGRYFTKIAFFSLKVLILLLRKRKRKKYLQALSKYVNKLKENRIS